MTFSLKNLIPRAHLYFFLGFSMLLSPLAIGADENEEDNRPEQYHYRPSPDAAADINETLARAERQEKLAMIVFGAEWCHDSRGFGSKLADPGMNAIIDASYEVVFVDLGYLEDHRALMAPLGYPINFGTPTVLVLDPETGGLLNFESVSTWQSAFSIEPAEYEAKFGGLAKQFSEGLLPPPSEALDPASQEFITREVERLATAYGVLGPMLEAYANKELEDREVFDAVWNEVRDFRAQLQRDITDLTSEGSGLESGKDAFPSYGPFSWEE